MIKFLEGWIETTLGEIAEIQTGPFGSQLHNKDYVDVGTPMITVEHIVGDRIQHVDDIPKVSAEDKKRLSKYILKKGDIVFSRVGSVDRSAYVSSKEDGWMFSGRLLRVRGYSSKSYANYLHYALTNKSTKQYIMKIAVGATMPSINTSILSEIPIYLPPLPEQKAIAKILSSFDEKIDLLREQNETLEVLAQTIFKEWFVNSDNPSTPILNFIEFNPVEKIDRNREYLFYDMKALPTDSMVMSKGVYKKSNSGTSFREKDTLLAKITPCLENGKTAFVLDIKGEEIARGSTEFIVMRAKKNGSPYLNYCLARYSLFRDYTIQSMVGTSGRQRVPIDRVKTFEINFSSTNIEGFDIVLQPIFEKIKNNASQIQTLAKTRDTLLPKLMSGEIRAEGFDQ